MLIVFVEMSLFKCNICLKSFKPVDNLNRHKKNVHKRKTEVQCKNCKKTYVEDNLKRHQKVCGKVLLYFDLIFNIIQIFIVVVRETTPIQKPRKVASEVTDGKFFTFF